MITKLIIALVAAIIWLIRDAIHQGKDFTFTANWKKYVGCFAGAALYGLLAEWKYFEYVSIIGIAALVGNSFSDVLNVLNWILSKVGAKTKL